jgi:hypothetical protein
MAASGGVQIESWQVASKFETVADLQAVAQQAARLEGSQWWWN